MQKSGNESLTVIKVLCRELQQRERKTSATLQNANPHTWKQVELRAEKRKERKRKKAARWRSRSPLRDNGERNHQVYALDTNLGHFLLRELDKHLHILMLW